MAWTQLSNEQDLKVVPVTCGGYCEIITNIKYKLWKYEPNNTDEDDGTLRIRIGLTYVKMVMALNTLSGDGGGYWNSSAISWFLGNRSNLYDSSISPYPYKSVIQGETYDTLPCNFTTSVTDMKYVSWNSYPILCMAFRDDLKSFSQSTLQFGYNPSTFSTSARAIIWGDLFKDSSKQPTITVSSSGITLLCQSSSDYGILYTDITDGEALSWKVGTRSGNNLKILSLSYWGRGYNEQSNGKKNSTLIRHSSVDDFAINISTGTDIGIEDDYTNKDIDIDSDSLDNTVFRLIKQSNNTYKWTRCDKIGNNA